MNLSAHTTRLLLLAMVATLVASPDVEASQEAEVAQTAPKKTKPPSICTFQGGRWCHGTLAPPPSGDTGSLCCSSGFCVQWDGGVCSGDLGWCNNFSTATDPETNVEVATCHDAA